MAGSACLSWLLWPVPALRVVNETAGTQPAVLVTHEGAPLALRYVHSIYREPATEELRVRRGGLDLVALRSQSVAVLEYYARPEPVRRDGAEHVVEVQGARFDRLRLRASELGQRTLHAGGRILPLHHLAADGDHLVLAVESVPRIETLWPPRPNPR